MNKVSKLNRLMETDNKVKEISIPIELFNAINLAFNDIRNHKINDPVYKDTYAIASAIDKIKDKHPGVVWKN